MQRRTTSSMSFLVFVSFLCFVKSSKGPCYGKPHGCCPNTQWVQEKEECVECPSGYYWINCSKSCPYPSFGERCKQNCSCTHEKCNFSTGCIEAVKQNTKDRYNISTLNAISTKETSRDKFILCTSGTKCILFPVLKTSI